MQNASLSSNNEQFNIHILFSGFLLYKTQNLPKQSGAIKLKVHKISYWF